MAMPSRRYSKRRKVCRFCADKSLEISYKNVDMLREFLTERRRMIPRRMSGNCAKHQRILAREIKVARNMALIPFTPD